jgi:hypothetical protein
MGSVLTAIAPTLYSAAQEVSGEPFGVVSAINMSFDNKGVAKGDSVGVPYMPAQSNTPFSPAAASSEGDGLTAAKVSVTITKSQKNSMVLTGEQIRSLENGGNYQEWVGQWAKQAMRALRNEAEADAALAVKYGASRVVGTAGTTPFASTMDSIVDVRALLRANGCPMSDPQLVLSPAAVGNLQKLGLYALAYAAGSDAERRSGVFGRQYGFQIRDSAGIVAHTAGTGASYVIGAASNTAKGSTVLTTSTAGSGTILDGDIITLQSDTLGRYVVNSSSVVAGTASNFTIGRPGLLQTTVAAKTITLESSYTPNLAFERSAVVGIMRPPLIPSNATIRQIPISDANGLTYLMLEIDQYGERSWEMHLAWGFKVVQGEHVAMIIG